MDKTTRFTLREIYEAAATYCPDMKYKTLYDRFRKAKAAGLLPESATLSSLTWEQARVLLQKKPRPLQTKPRPQAISILRKALKDDGIF